MTALVFGDLGSIWRAQHSQGALPCTKHGQGPLLAEDNLRSFFTLPTSNCATPSKKPFVAEGCEGDQGELGIKVDVQRP